MTVRMSRVGRGLCSISCCITTASTSWVYTCFSAKHSDVALMTVLTSHLEGSILCRATNSSAGVTGLVKLAVDSTWLPNRRLNTSLTTMGFSLMSLGRAAITSFFDSPLSTGMRKRTSETRLWYRSRTRATSSAEGGVLSVRMWMIRVTSVSAPLGQFSTSSRSSGDDMPIPFTGPSSPRRMVRLISAMAPT
uniref:Uncharacterized protein n=1 Tax=Ixodes ricinus TaxID=34613 RepID=A0A6B0V0B3_IXORI